MAKRLLLIDDERDFTELAGTILRFHGFDVEAVNDPHEGLKRLEQGRFDALILDIMMPDLDGLAIVSRLRGTPAHEDTPIFVVSAKDLTDEDRKLLLNAKVHFVQKPFEPRRLAQIIRDKLSAGA